MELVLKRLPQDAVDIMVLSDSHIGSKWFNTLAWQYAIDVARKAHMRVLFDGDLLDVATITSKTPPWDQAMNLHDAMAYAPTGSIESRLPIPNDDMIKQIRQYDAGQVRTYGDSACSQRRASDRGYI